MEQANFDRACYYYNMFLTKYSKSHNYNGKNYSHSIPSSFVYHLVRDNCIWLLNLIMGVAGYSMYFDEDTETSKVLTKELLDAAGVIDPVVQYKSSIVPWSGLTSSGKSPWAPVDKVVTGVGIAHFNRGGLDPFYHCSPITATLPKIDSTGTIIRDESGVMQVESYTVCYESQPVYGWGMGYGNNKLSLQCITNNTSGLCYLNSEDGKCALKGKLNDNSIKLIGPDYGAKFDSTSYMTKSEADTFVEWCRYHLMHKRDMYYPPLLWMAKYWAPFYSWHNGTQENTIQAVMMASSAYNSGGMSKESMNGKSAQAIMDMYINKGSDRDHRMHRIVNTQRAIALLEFIKRV